MCKAKQSSRKSKYFISLGNWQRVRRSRYERHTTDPTTRGATLHLLTCSTSSASSAQEDGRQRTHPVQPAAVQAAPPVAVLASRGEPAPALLTAAPALAVLGSRREPAPASHAAPAPPVSASDAPPPPSSIQCGRSQTR